jgi:flagellar basal-body rod protein FlgB
MNSPLDAALAFHQRALDVRAQRQQLIASNIANADTPNYKARDIDFRSALEAALKPGASAAGLARTAPGHLGGSGAVAGAPLLYRQTVQASVDGNSVDIDVERAQFADNALRYEANLMFISGQIRGMLSAIQG